MTLWLVFFQILYSQRQRDPRLNEILFPFYNHARVKNIIHSYEPDQEYISKGKITYLTPALWNNTQDHMNIFCNETKQWPWITRTWNMINTIDNQAESSFKYGRMEVFQRFVYVEVNCFYEVKLNRVWEICFVLFLKDTAVINVKISMRRLKRMCFSGNMWKGWCNLWSDILSMFWIANNINKT